MCAQQRFRSACDFAQSDQNNHWAHLDSQGCKVSSCERRSLWSDCANAQADLSLRSAHMSKYVFLTSRLIIVYVDRHIKRWMKRRQKCISWLRKLSTENRPRWLSWMRHPIGDQEVAGSTPAEVGNILSWRLIVKYFLRSFSPFRWFKKGSCQFLAKECARYW